MNSMTGYGQGVAQNENSRIVVDIKSVNGKFLDVNTKIMRQFISAEEIIKTIIGSKLNRGSIDVYVNYYDLENTGDVQAKIDFSLAESLLVQSQQLAQKLNISNNISSKDLMKFNDVVVYEKKELDLESIIDLIKNATLDAVKNLIIAREREGESLYNDLSNTILNMSNSLEKIKQIAPTVKDDYAEKLRARITDMLKDVAIDETKFLNEVAFFIDKSDINEEIVRLDTHIKNFKNIMINEKLVGKKFEFLSQEMTREINTLGSKANNILLTNEVLFLKNENEKIKEQIRNVE